MASGQNTAPSTAKIWYVKDFLSGATIDNRYFSEFAEAVAYRNELGYGIVSSYNVRE